MRFANIKMAIIFFLLTLIIATATGLLSYWFSIRNIEQEHDVNGMLVELEIVEYKFSLTYPFTEVDLRIKDENFSGNVRYYDVIADSQNGDFVGYRIFMADEDKIVEIYESDIRQIVDEKFPSPDKINLVQ